MSTGVRSVAPKSQTSLAKQASPKGHQPGDRQQWPTRAESKLAQPESSSIAIVFTRTGSPENLHHSGVGADWRSSCYDELTKHSNGRNLQARDGEDYRQTRLLLELLPDGSRIVAVLPERLRLLGRYAWWSCPRYLGHGVRYAQST